MSKQQGIDVPEVVERDTGKHKKRKGVYELWMKFDGNAPSFFTREWHRVRSYETKEIAEKNLRDHTRKWNRIPSQFKWSFEIREKGKQNV